MKKRVFASIVAAILLIVGIAIAADLQPIAVTFIGRWQPTDDAVLIDEHGLQDIQNLRKSGKHFKGISGHSVINSTSLSATPYFLNGFHFVKSTPAESHVIVLASASTSTPTASYLYQNTTAIPSAGTFSATTLHTDAAGGIGTGRFSRAPGGAMVYCNGPETLIWSGNEMLPTAFITATAALTGTESVLTNPNDYTSQVRNTRTTADQVAIVGGGASDAYTKVLLHCDGTDGEQTFTDEQGHTFTANGHVNTDDDQYKFGGASGYFDGSGDYLSASASSDFDFGTGDWTIDFWIRRDGAPPKTWGIISSATSSSTGWAIVSASTTAYPEIVSKASGTWKVDLAMSAAPTNQVWAHVAFVRYGNTLKAYLDGVSKGSLNVTGYNYNSAGYGLVVGRYITDTNDYYHKGHLDEIRISKGIARWTGDFTPSISAYRADAGSFLAGFTRPVQSVKLYVSDPNVSTSTMAVSEWNGTTWSALSATDNTASGGITLAQTGTVTFPSTVDTAKQRYIHGYSLYWYQFSIDAGQATIYHVTGDAPMQPIRNIWDGSAAYVTKATLYTGTAYEDYTDIVNDQAPSTTMKVSSLSTSGYVLIGFTQAMQALTITFDAGKENTTGSTTMSGYYWDGQQWKDLPAMTDGTATGTTSLAKNGTVSWQAPGAGVEFPTAIGDETPLFYYKLSFAAAPDAETEIGEVRGVTAPNPIATYKFSEVYQNHLFLFNEYNGLKNKAIYSMEAAPDIFNGAYTGTFYFGDDTDIIAAANVYNVFGNSAYDQLIVGKRSEIYRLSGDYPSAWTSKRISSTVGCAAPLSMVSAVAHGLTEDDNPKNVVIWQGDEGFYMTDGATVTPISEDIKVYFDENDSRCIPTTRLTKTVAWYDPSIPAYKALISSGSTATYHNVELEYSLKHREWTKIVRVDASGSDPLQCGFRVFNTDGIGYTYGGNTKGFLYRLEYGATFAGTAIEQMLWTKDMILDTEAPLFRKSTIKHLRTAMKKKTAGGTVTVAHYGDKVLSVDGTSNQAVPDAINMATAHYNTQSCNLGPFLYHSLKYTLSGSTVADGMELIGLGIWSEPYTALR